LRISPQSFGFTLLLGFLSSLPTFGIDMVLPSLSATGAALGARTADLGLVISAYMLGLGAGFVVYGPISDRIGRKPVVVFGAALLIAASTGAIFAQNFPQLLLFRALQGAGASGPGIGAVMIVQDLFDGAAARAKMSFVVFAINIVPMIAPTVGAVLLTIAGWQTIYLLPLVGGCIIVIAMQGLGETARIDPNAKVKRIPAIRSYLSVITHPVCLGNALSVAGATGAVFAYVTGSSLFFLKILSVTPLHYGFIFGASSLAVMVGSLANMRLSTWGFAPNRLIVAGLILSTLLAASLLIMALIGGKSGALFVLVMVGVALSFGVIAPNTMNAAVEPMPDIVGAASAVMAFAQMVAAALSSALVTGLFDGRTAASIGIVMLGCCLIATASYFGIARPAERAAAMK
jgi:MFS transporter, DHA1 family, multidrug resistance protein